MLAAGPALANEAGVSCKTSHNLVAACFAVHGRLFMAGGGHVRIEWLGEGRVLDVRDRQSRAQGGEIVPDLVQRTLSPSTDVYGDFLVCPFDRGPRANVQAVCIEDATGLSTRRR